MIKKKPIEFGAKTMVISQNQLKKDMNPGQFKVKLNPLKAAQENQEKTISRLIVQFIIKKSRPNVTSIISLDFFAVKK